MIYIRSPQLYTSHAFGYNSRHCVPVAYSRRGLFASILPASAPLVVIITRGGEGHLSQMRQDMIQWPRIYLARL
jgi:hypothetical protein